jgi:quinohemoprotein ethanol dehydrogenase
MARFGRLAAALVCAVLGGCGPTSLNPAADRDWPVYGGESSENHYSPLAQIDRSTVEGLGLVWSADLGTPYSATGPIAVGGVVYVAAGASVVQAFAVADGRVLWQFDPDVAASPEKSRLRGTGWGIRGLSYDNGRLFVGTKDGRLIAIDARTGKPQWSVMTLEPGMDSAAITGVPRVFAGKVIIGFGGGDLGTTRGYVTAYDQKTGRREWRFFIVPGDPAAGFENDAMAKAASTWTGKWWRFGGGGTVWNAITYDAQFNRIYLGTGNGSPWNRKIRSPGGGDNLFLSSVVALDADTGEYLWHHQTVPGDTWDYNSSMDIELATLDIGGKKVPVLYHAPKNGYFYVLDRRDGSVISATAWSKVTWSTGFDNAAGRPIEAADARYENGPVLLYPGAIGAHSVQPMSSSPRTGLVYIPETIAPGAYADIPNISGYVQRSGVHEATGIDFSAGTAPSAAAGEVQLGSALVAWDPARKVRRWSVKLPGLINGGALSTAGGLVFQGRIDGLLAAYSDETGKLLWSYDTGGPITAPVITYSVGGQQYVTVVNGIAGGSATTGAIGAQFGWDYRTYPRRVLTFAIGGKKRLPPRPPKVQAAAMADSAYVANATLAARGGAIYTDRSCIACHGPEAISAAVAPDLRASGVVLDAGLFRQVVQGGQLAARGMPQYEDLSNDEVEALRQYLRARADALRRQ